MARNEQLTLTIRARNLFVGTFRKATASVRQFAAGTVRAAKRVGVAFLAMAAVATVAFKKLFTLYTENARAQRKLAQAVRTTGGAAGFTAGELGKEAARLHELTGASEKVIKNAQAIQLTFLNIKGDHFLELTERALDLAEVMSEVNGEGVSLREGIVRLSKALNDPRTGMANLRRVGISFTQSQVEMAKALQDSGDLLGAQRLILDELDRELAGFASNTDETTKAWNKLKNSLSKAGAQLGGALLKVNGVEGGLKGIRRQVDELASSGRLEQIAEELANIGAAGGNAFRYVSERLSALDEWATLAESLWEDRGKDMTFDEKVLRAYDRMDEKVRKSAERLKKIRKKTADDAIANKKREASELEKLQRQGLVKSTAETQFDLSKQIDEIGKLGDAAAKAIDPLSGMNDLLARWPSLKPEAFAGDIGQQLERTFQDVEQVAAESAAQVAASIQREKEALTQAAKAAEVLQVALAKVKEADDSDVFAKAKEGALQELKDQAEELNRAFTKALLSGKATHNEMLRAAERAADAEKAYADAVRKADDARMTRPGEVAAARALIPVQQKAVALAMEQAKAEREKRKAVEDTTATLQKQRAAVAKLRNQYKKFRDDAKKKIKIELEIKKIDKQIDAIQKKIRKALFLDVPDRRARQRAFEERRGERGRVQDERREDNARANKLIERLENGQHVKKQNLQWLRDQRRFHRAEQVKKRGEAKIAELAKTRTELQRDANKTLLLIRADLLKNLQAG